MEKDIVIEQLRNQLKQLRSKVAVMEEEQAADTAPLQGLLSQLGELKVRASIYLSCVWACLSSIVLCRGPFPRGPGSVSQLWCRDAPEYV